MVAGSASQQNNLNGKGGGPHLAIGASNIFFTAKGRSIDGLQYKYRGAMESYPGGKSTSGSPIYFTQNYIEFLDNWGTFQVGNLTGPEDTMTESFFNLAGGALTIDGTFPNMVNTAEGVISGVQMYGQTSKATKMVYYTPSLAGVQLGVAFTPNTTRFGMGGLDNSGASPNNTYGNESGIYPNRGIAPYGMNNVSLGINYKADFKTWNMALAAIYIQENTKRGSPTWGEEGRARAYDDSQIEFFKIKKPHNARSGQLTAAVGFGQWRFATGYINNGKSRILKTKESGYNSGDAGRAWNVGGQYTIGAYQFALGYFNTSRALPKLPANGTTYVAVTGKAKSDIVSATIDFNALQGLKFFGEVDFFKTSTDKNYAKFIKTTTRYSGNNIAAVSSNSGMAGVVGAKLSF
jgi:predicted porin